MATRSGPKTAYLTLDSLKYLGDSMFGAVVNEEIEKLVKDIEDRGTDGLARVLTITVTLTPSDRGEIVQIVPKVAGKVPAHKPAKTMAKLNKNRDAILFNPEVAESPDQQTFADLAVGDGETD